MRLRDFIREEAQDGAGPGSNKGSTSSLHPNHEKAIPNMQSYPDLPSHYYDMYRFGVHMAGSPSDENMPKNGPAANFMSTLAYSSADKEIIQKTAKALGYKQKKLSPEKSNEEDNVGKMSPVSQWNNKKK
jgi:hypothetical protein